MARDRIKNSRLRMPTVFILSVLPGLHWLFWFKSLKSLIQRQSQEIVEQREMKFFWQTSFLRPFISKYTCVKVTLLKSINHNSISLHDGKILYFQEGILSWRQECNYCTACISKCEVTLLQIRNILLCRKKYQLA